MKAKVIGMAAALFLLWWMTGTARANFELHGVEQKTVDTFHVEGRLYDQSKAWVVSGGEMYRLYAHDASTVDISGGWVGELTAAGSTVNISGGSVSNLYAWGYPYGSSTVNISGGSVDLYAYGESVSNYISAEGTSTVNITGGSASTLYTKHSSTVIFVGRNFHPWPGLTLVGDKVTGTGYLEGEWLDGTPWTVNISRNDPGATIQAIPEPATLSLLALGGLAMMRRRRRMA